MVIDYFCFTSCFYIYLNIYLMKLHIDYLNIEQNQDIKIRRRIIKKDIKKYKIWRNSNGIF